MKEVIDGNTAKKFIELWGKVSNGFLHFKGYAKKLLEWSRSEEYEAPSSWAVGAFVSYEKEDEENMQYLITILKELTQLLKALYEKMENQFIAKY
ncbi:MAG: hypothetical protein QW758_02035 [Candidatus Aenigmatarchaeota archaeon]